MKTLILFTLASVFAAILAQRSCPTVGNVQLVPTSTISGSSNAGRLEVCNADGVWSTVANTETGSNRFWSGKNVQVACVQLGFTGGLNSIPPDQLAFVERLGPRDGTPVSYASVQCDGTENSLTSCSHSVLMGDEFDHSLDVFMVCRPRTFRYSEIHPPGVQVGDVRLVGDEENGQGAVEIYTTEFGWTGICPDGSWGDSDAGVICENFGYETGRIENYVLPAGAIDQRVIADARCSQTPSSDISRLQAGDCTFQLASGIAACSNLNTYAGVICRTSSSEESVRLVGQGVLEPESDAGVVEILYNNRWGVLCQPPPEQLNRFINIVCRRFDYNRAESRSIESSRVQEVESNLKPVWWSDDADCPEGVDSISGCVVQPFGIGNCSNGVIIVVECRYDGLRPQYIVLIVLAVLFAIAFILVMVYNKQIKEKWNRRHQSTCYNRLTTPRRWCECVCPEVRSRPQARAEAPAQVPAEVPAEAPPPPTSSASRRSSTSSSSDEDEPQLQDPKLSKTAPPSYRAAFDIPTHVPQDDQPPPYSIGGPVHGVAYPPTNVPYPATSGASAAYPPAPTSGAAYPPTATATPYPPIQTIDTADATASDGDNYQGYPPPGSYPSS